MSDAAPAIIDTSRRAAFAEFWHYFAVNKGAVIGLGVFTLLVLIAIFAPLIAPHLPDQQYRDSFLVPPIWNEGGKSGFILGTDPVGRDILSRLIHGARFSLLMGLMVVVLALTSGVILGLLAGYFRGWVDALIMRVMDIILAFPSLLLALVMVAILGPGLVNAMLSIALVYQPHFARLTRAAVMGEKGREYG
jgi:dipeptide transport system permease protein